MYYLLFFLFFTHTLLAQSSQELQEKRLALEKKIEQNQYFLQHTRQEQKNNLQKLYLLNQQISQREQLVGSIAKELHALEQETQAHQNKVFLAQKDLHNYQTEYAAMVYMASKTNNALKKLSYIFAAKSFNQLLARLNYFEQYSQARKKQIEQIQKKAQEVVEHQHNLEENISFKKKLLVIQSFQQEYLKKAQQDYAKTIEQLKKQESQLLAEFEQQQNQIQALNQSISQLIAQQQDNYKNTPETKNNETAFAYNKSLLVWPVEKGYISKKFGIYQDPVFEKVRLENLGIDIRTEHNAHARAVFAGKVIAVQNLPDKGMIVMLQHGEFYTVYANLAQAKVQIGEQVESKQTLGIIQNIGGVTELQFQIWKNTQKLNPEEWLAQ